MIKAVAATGDGRTMLILGLSRDNTRELHRGRPIPIDTETLDPRLPPMTILIFAGDTEDAMAAELHAQFKVEPS